LRRVGAATLKAKPLSLASLAEAGFCTTRHTAAGSACLDLQDLAPSIHSHSALDPSPVFHFAAAFSDEVLVWF